MSIPSHLLPTFVHADAKFNRQRLFLRRVDVKRHRGKAREPRSSPLAILRAGIGSCISCSWQMDALFHRESRLHFYFPSIPAACSCVMARLLSLDRRSTRLLNRLNTAETTARILFRKSIRRNLNLFASNYRVATNAVTCNDRPGLLIVNS
ncbi:hypothetical protein PUN28_001291 [Cardiocondyla obscurior]|uniref:Uncharacterized protein n=1 Tax=Cardiocondyla obscurior TaxID=286306 RepID=A0AAW2H484_9HYME